MKVVWSHRALQRLGEIEDFVAADSVEAAIRLTGELVDRADALSRFPEAGRALPELPKSGLRELVEGNYRIVYRIGFSAVEVVTVIEGHRMLPEGDLR
jgi:plasmid stabilization system protein ParE